MSFTIKTKEEDAPVLKTATALQCESTDDEDDNDDDDDDDDVDGKNTIESVDICFSAVNVQMVLMSL